MIFGTKYPKPIIVLHGLRFQLHFFSIFKTRFPSIWSATEWGSKGLSAAQLNLEASCKLYQQFLMTWQKEHFCSFVRTVGQDPPKSKETSSLLADKQIEHVESIKFSWVSKLNFMFSTRSPVFVVYPLEGLRFLYIFGDSGLLCAGPMERPEMVTALVSYMFWDHNYS